MIFPDKRGLKNRLNSFTKKFQNAHRDGKSIYVIDCRWHPCKVLTFGWHPQDVWGASLDVESLVDSLVSSCSMFHCGITDVDEKKAFEMRDYFRKHGEHRYMIDIIGYSETELGELEDALGVPRST